MTTTHDDLPGTTRDTRDPAFWREHAEWLDRMVEVATARGDGEGVVQELRLTAAECRRVYVRMVES